MNGEQMEGLGVGAPEGAAGTGIKGCQVLTAGQDPTQPR